MCGYVSGLLSVLAHIILVRLRWRLLCQAEDGIRDLVRSRGLGDVYKRQDLHDQWGATDGDQRESDSPRNPPKHQPDRPEFAWNQLNGKYSGCLLYTSDAADERSSVDLGGRRIIKKKKREHHTGRQHYHTI